MFTVIQLDFDQMCVLPLSVMLHKRKGLSLQRMSRMGDTHRHRMCVNVCIY